MINIDLETIYYEPECPVLKNVRLDIKEGEIVALTGPSGIGKSTILKILAGIHDKYTGMVEMPEDARIAFISQNKCLLPWKNVYKNICLLCKVKGMDIQKEKVANLIENLGLTGLEKKYPIFLSGGQYQRAALGQVFLYEPDILLMDEPFSALDSQTKKEVMDVFLKLHNERKITTLMVTHNLEEAKYLKSRIINLKKGD